MSYKMDVTHLGKTAPIAGDQIYPDQWPGESTLVAPDTFDRQYFGWDILRVETGHSMIPTLPVRVNITGRKATYCHMTSDPGRVAIWKVRARIEFVRDGEPSEFTNGWLFFKA